MSIDSELAPAPVPTFQNAYADVFHGDCLEVMRALPSGSVDSCVTDPPYGLSRIDEQKTRQALDAWLGGDDAFIPDGRGFMNKRWDMFVPPPAVWREVERLLRPGGHVVCFAGSRTVDLMMLSIRLGGLEIVGTSEWAYGSGMPKSMNVGRALDKRSGFVGAVIGTEQVDIGMQGGQLHTGRPKNVVTREVRALSDEGQRWAGWGTALKPAHEPIVIARKAGPVGLAAPRIPPFIYTGKAKRDERPVLVDDDGNTVAHSTVKPTTLVRTLCEAVTPAGGVVLDPFLGSGTTCEAATQAGFDSVGIELDDTHVPLIVERLTGRDIWAGGLLD